MGVSFSSLSVRVEIGFGVIIKIFEFIILLELLLLGSWEDIEELGDLVWLEGSFFGEFDIEFDIEVSVTHLVFPEGHTLVLDTSDILV